MRCPRGQLRKRPPTPWDPPSAAVKRVLNGVDGNPAGHVGCVAVAECGCPKLGYRCWPGTCGGGQAGRDPDVWLCECCIQRPQVVGLDDAGDRAAAPQRGAHVLHARCEPGAEERLYRLVLGLLGDITPVVPPVPPAAAFDDQANALAYLVTDRLRAGTQHRDQSLDPVEPSAPLPWAQPGRQ